MDCTGVYNTDGKLTGVTISAEKEAEILSYDFTGNGTASDPYQINTTNGFWYMSSFVNLTNKYVELNCDVILNDEVFDENGNASGGDGVVYQWRTYSVCANMNFYGQSHKILGLFFNDENVIDSALFFEANTGVNIISDLTLKNVYMNGQQNMYAFGYFINVVENCRLETSFIKAKTYCAAFAYRVKKMRNCVNFSKVFAEKYAFGICYTIKDFAENCENYGNLEGNIASGIIYSLSNNGKIFLCKNYGNINLQSDNIWLSSGIICVIVNNNEISCCENYGNIAGNSNIGGIVGIIYSSAYLCKISSCTNYGDIISTASTGYSTGGCVALYTQSSAGNKCSLIIECFKNYGNFKRAFANDTCACVIGQVSQAEGGLTIKDCYLEIDESKSAYAVFTNHTSAKNLDVQIYNNTIIIKNVLSYFCFSGFVTVNSYEIKDCIINIDSLGGGQSTRMQPIDTLYYGNVYIKNIILNCKVGKLNWSVPNVKSSDLWYQNGILILGQDQNSYIGTNFRDFYVSWKYGTIGLKTLDGVGSAQGSITTDWLDKNGWEKVG